VTAQPHDLDYLNRAVADRWLDLLLGEHEARLGDHVGTTLQAYGPDEMYVLRGNILYSPALVERFRAEKGYDPLPHLAGIFRDIGPKTDKIRCDYYDVMVSLLDENFYEPIADWLHQRGMLYTTIATWGRCDPVGQTYHYGDFFRMMRHFDVTGNEDPARADVTHRRFIDAKLSSSVAHLYGRSRAAVCAYWGSGWGVSQEENLAWTFANYAWGMNLYNRHGGLYSTLGGWYEWVPPAVHFRQPYWQYWRHFTDCVRRLSYIMSQGTHVADVAILYPLTTMHAGWRGGDDFSDAAREAGARMMSLARTIYFSGIDFDFIDDASLCRGRVSDGTLQVSGIPFQAVVLPPLTTIRTDTLEQLRAFYGAGGTVIAFGRLPDASPEHGRADPKVRSLVKEIFGIEPVEGPSAATTNGNGRGGKAFFVPHCESQVVSVISDAIARDVEVPEGDVFHTHRKAGDADIFLLFNARAEKRRISARLRVMGEPELWDPLSGDVEPVHRFDHENGTTRVALDTAPYQGVVLVLTPPTGRPHAVGDDLDRIVDLAPGGGGIEVTGLCGAGGRKRVRIKQQDAEFAAEKEVAPPPESFALERPWRFRLEPTLDNRWGDFRYPPSEELIGPEAHRFRYMEETGQPGTQLGWHERDLDDSDWRMVTCTYGPYWWTLGPFGETHEPRSILEDVIAGRFDPARTFDIAGRPFQWEPFRFSQKYGHEEPQGVWGGLTGVEDEFLVFPPVGGGRDGMAARVRRRGAGAEAGMDQRQGSRRGLCGQARREGRRAAQEGPQRGASQDCPAGGREGGDVRRLARPRRAAGPRPLRALAQVVQGAATPGLRHESRPREPRRVVSLPGAAGAQGPPLEAQCAKRSGVGGRRAHHTGARHLPAGPGGAWRAQGCLAIAAAALLSGGIADRADAGGL